MEIKQKLLYIKQFLYLRKKRWGALIRGEALIRDYTVPIFHLQRSFSSFVLDSFLSLSFNLFFFTMLRFYELFLALSV